MNDIQKAKEQLSSGGYTCVLCKGQMQYTSRERGVKPLMNWLSQNIDLEGFSAADKVVGRATAFLYILLGVKQVYASVMSQSAADIFVQYGVPMEAELIVPAIKNRSGTGFCPMELATQDCATPEEAYRAIRETIKRIE